MGDRVAEAVAELYAGPLEDFTPRRTALAKDARAGKDRDAAQRIGGLRKPTRAAFAVNQLARAHPERMAELLELGTDLREAERSLDGPAMRELSGRRRGLADDLAAVAFSLIDESDPATALQEDVLATLNAAVADEEIGAAVAAGALVKPVHWEGFGSVALADVLATPDAARAPAPPARKGAPSARDDGGMPGTAGEGDPDAETSGSGDGPTEPSAPAPAPAATRPDDAARERRSATRRAEQDRAARAAEREAAIAERRRAQREEIETARTAATDAQAAVRAAHQAVEDRTAEVRAVQEQLAQARNRLDDARFAVRRAEIDEQKAAQALDRLNRRAR